MPAHLIVSLNANRKNIMSKHESVLALSTIITFKDICQHFTQPFCTNVNSSWVPVHLLQISWTMCFFKF
jgi:hypothetical protein